MTRMEGMTIDFHRIRAHRGSQQNGFEELCCQLAGCERPENAARLVRNAPPDAGVECYWVLANGDEHGWQAKYFDKLDDSQWRQLDHSVETALNKHPRLVRYVVCLPIDLPDARIDSRKSLREKWEDRVTQWEQRAEELGMMVRFELWGEHELATRLVDPIQAGRRLYWFGGTVFSAEWMKERLRETVRFAGPRYTPDLHVQLPLYGAFEGLGYTKAHCDSLRGRFDSVRERWHRVCSELNGSGVVKTLGNALPELQRRYEAAVAWGDRYGNLDECPPIDDVRNAIEQAARATVACISALNHSHPPDHGEIPHRNAPSRFSWQARLLNELADELESLADYCATPEFQLTHQPALLLAGPGGYGKTHALCDLADRRIVSAEPTILLLGQQLGDNDPWRAIINRLGLDCSRDEFLGALQAAAEAAGSRALLLLDAINEAGSIGWRDELPAMLDVVGRYPRVGFAVSCRDVAEAALIRDDLVRSRLVRVEHTGLLGRLDEAIERFGRSYGVTELHVPILSAEFASPLFLKLFFRTRSAHSDYRMPAFRGLADLFDSIVRDLDERLSGRDQLDYHPGERRVQRAVERIATLLLDARRRALPVQLVIEEIQQIHPATDFSKSLLGRLLDEGIFTEDTVGFEGRDERVIRFAYERHGEHSMAQVLLSRVRAEVSSPGEESPTLRWLLQDDDTVARRGWQGLIVATCSLAPDFLGHELFEIAPWVRDWPAFARLYLASLAIRSAASVGSSGVAFVEELLTREAGKWSSEVLAAVLEVSVVPQHPLNARWLDSYLRSLPMPERDAVWSTFLHGQWERGGGITRLIDWAWPEDCEVRDPAAGVDPETVELAALCLGWCLSTPNRFVRDRATKALVSLLQWRPEAVAALIDALGQSDDPYVVERVFAVAYGCILRSDDRDGIAIVARTVFRRAFAGSPPTDVLTRDHARGCVERALSIGCLRESDLDVSRIRPPYNSNPLMPPPDWDTLQARHPDDDFGVLFFALKGQMSDFTRYVLERTGLGIAGEGGWTDSSTSPQSETARPYTVEELETIGQILETLATQIVVGSPPPGSEADESAGDDHEGAAAEIAFPATDGATEAPTLPPAVQEREESDSLIEPSEDRVGADYASRWILQRVVEIGWTPERFAQFDQQMNTIGLHRFEDKPERMSKKYQWIALREFMARHLDRCTLRHSDGYTMQYEGVADVGLRDLDPSLLARGPTDVWSRVRPSTWWVPVPDPVPAGAELDDVAWLRLLAPLPNPQRLVTVQEPGEGRNWSVLSLAATWEESPDGMAKRRGDRKRRVSFTLGGWIVPRSTADAQAAALANWEFAGGDFGEFNLYHQLLGEYFWASSFKPFRDDSKWNFEGDPGTENTQVFRPAYGSMHAAATSHRYIGEGRGYDCSLTETVSGRMPSVWLAERLNMRWTRKYFRFADQDGRLLSFDPAAEVGGPGALLVCRNVLADFLRDQRLTLFTAIVGEKNVWSPSGVSQDDLWPGRLVFRRLLRDDGEGPSIVRAWSLLHQRDKPDEQFIELE